MEKIIQGWRLSPLRDCSFSFFSPLFSSFYFCLLATIQVVPAQAADPVRIVSGGPAALSLFTPHRAELERLAGTSVEVSVNPSDIAMMKMAEGTIDGVIAPPIDEALAAAEKRGAPKQNPADYEYFEFFDNVIKIGISPDNPVKDLTRSQITDILSGKITNWQSITGQNLPITAFIARNYMTSARAVTQFYIKSDTSPVAKYVLDKDGLLKALARDPGAIGFFTAKDSSPTFTPKFFKTEVARTTMLIIRKNARPEMRRVFEFLKAKPKHHFD